MYHPIGYLKIATPDPLAPDADDDPSLPPVLGVPEALLVVLVPVPPPIPPPYLYGRPSAEISSFYCIHLDLLGFAKILQRTLITLSRNQLSFCSVITLLGIQLSYSSSKARGGNYAPDIIQIGQLAVCARPPIAARRCISGCVCVAAVVRSFRYPDRRRLAHHLAAGDG